MKIKLYFVITLLIFFTLAVLSQSFAQGPLAQPSVRLVYFLPSDRPARPARIEAFRQLIKDTQQFYADEMERHGFGRKTFRIETDRNGEPMVHRFNGRFNEHHYYKRLTDFKVWEEFFQQVNDLQHVYLIAIDMSYELLNEGESCGLGGVSFLPSGTDSPSFSFGSAAVRHRDITPGEEVLGGSAIMPASGHCFYDTRGFLHPLRLITHELAHAFGLDHDFSDPDSAVGGRGFRFSECDTEWLSVSRFFNSKTVSKNELGNIQLISAPTYSAEGIALHFEVSDADGLHQAQLLVPENGSWGPWKLIGCQALDGPTQRVEFLSEGLITAPVERIMLQFMDDLGNITWATFLTDISSIIPPPKTVSIPDRNLATAVREALGLRTNARITDQAMKRLTTLDARENQIQNLGGLEHATQLTNLELYKNQIRDVSPLTGLTQLRRLSLDANQISDIRSLSGLTQLEGLYIGENQINNSGVELLTKFKQLKWLSLYGNQISDIKPLANLTKLTGLWINHNQIRDVSPLMGLVNLEVLHLKGNPIQDTSPLASLTKLREVDIEIPPPSPIVHIKASQRPPLYWIDPAAGTLHRLVGPEVENLAQSFRNATSLAIDVVGGKLYWTERTGNRTGKIRRSNLNGTNAQLVKRLTSVPLSITLDTLNRKIYLTNSWGKVQRLNIDGSNFQPNLIKGLQTPNHLTLDVTRGKIYWTEQTSDRIGKIRRANLDGTNVELVKDLTSAPRGIALDTTNRKIYLTNASGKVQRMNLNGSSFQPNLITRLESPEGIAVDAVNRKLYWTEKGSIRRANLNGKNIKNIVTGLDAPANIALGIVQTDAAIAAPPATIRVIPDETDLYANYPNPFNPETWIPYQLSKAADVTLTIYAVNGQLIRTLALGQQPAGIYHSRSRAAYWDGRNGVGEKVASGVYFYTLTAGDFAATRKMLIMK